MDSTAFQKTVCIFFYDPNIFPNIYSSISQLTSVCTHLCCVCIVVVAKRFERYTLTCSSKADEGVTWKMEGNRLDDEENVKRNGPNLTVLEVDTPSLGNYSCWKGDEMLSSTYLLLEDDEEHDLGEFLFHFSIILLFTCCK